MITLASTTEPETDPVARAFNRAIDYWDDIRAIRGSSHEHRVEAISDIHQLLPKGMYKSDAGQILEGARIAAISEAHEQELNDLLLLLTNHYGISLKVLRDKEGIGQIIPEPDSSVLYALARVTLHASEIHGGELPKMNEQTIPLPSDLGFAGLRISA